MNPPDPTIVTLSWPFSKAKLPMAKVNPWQARRFAQATGQRAKTDAVDARMLACMAATLALRPTPACVEAPTGIERLANRKKQTHPGPHRRTQPGRSSP